MQQNVRKSWFNTDPRVYFVFPVGSATAASTASEIAIPRLPGVSGSAASTARPAAVCVLGLEMQVPPQVFISILRNGFCSKLTRTIKTLHSMPPIRAQAKDRALPH